MAALSYFHLRAGEAFLPNEIFAICDLLFEQLDGVHSTLLRCGRSKSAISIACSYQIIASDGSKSSLSAMAKVDLLDNFMYV